MFITKKSVMTEIARIIPIRMSQGAFGPVPKTIGNGPIKITTPTLEELLKSREATTKITTPMKTKVIPKIRKPISLLDTGMPSSSVS